MTWLAVWAAISTASFAAVVGLWWVEVGRHDRAERRNAELHQGRSGRPGHFDADPDTVRFLDRHRHEEAS